MFGMFLVMCTAAFWDNVTCHLELPVSTTHTTGMHTSALCASKPRPAWGSVFYTASTQRYTAAC